VLDGELCDHSARPKYIPVAPDVVAEDLGENAPVLQAPVDCLVTRPDAALHLSVLGGTIDVVLGALDFVRVPAVAVVGLDTLARLEKVRQARGEDLDVWPRPGGVRALDPGSTLGSPSGCPPSARSGGRTSPRTCGARRRSPSSQLPFGGCESPSRPPT
jgi:hypothetical protein